MLFDGISVVFVQAISVFFPSSAHTAGSRKLVHAQEPLLLCPLLRPAGTEGGSVCSLLCRAPRDVIAGTLTARV